MQAKKLKRAVIKEEYVAITGDPIEALILNQFIYWSERVKDADKFIEEEKNRYANEGFEINMPVSKGWIYKKSEELGEEIMLKMSIPTIRKYIKNLIEKGFIMERCNPNLKWDKTKQYRVNFLKIYESLKVMGYMFDGFVIDNTNMPETPKLSNLNNLNTELKNLNPELKNLTAIPEITTEIINKNNNNSENLKETQKKQKNVVVVSEIENLKKDIDSTLNIKFNINQLKRLVNSKGIDKVRFYLDNFDKYAPDKIISISGTFASMIMTEYEAKKAKTKCNDPYVRVDKKEAPDMSNYNPDDWIIPDVDTI